MSANTGVTLSVVVSVQVITRNLPLVCSSISVFRVVLPVLVASKHYSV